ncbi:MAG: hypothetical protein R3F43_31295 [bacterium]
MAIHLDDAGRLERLTDDDALELMPASAPTAAGSSMPATSLGFSTSTPSESTSSGPRAGSPTS